MAAVALLPSSISAIGVLPGLGAYAEQGSNDEEEDSDDSSNSSEDLPVLASVPVIQRAVLEQSRAGAQTKREKK